MSKREILRREQERESLKMKRRKITYVAVGLLALSLIIVGTIPVSYTHLRAHET